MKSPANPTNEVEIPADVVRIWRKHPLLKPLTAVAAGFATRSDETLNHRSASEEILFLYCVKGSGVCVDSGVLKPFKQGDVLVIPPRADHKCRMRASTAWAVHWARARGELIPDYISALGLEAPSIKVLPLGDNAEITRLFNETLRSLQRGAGLFNLLRASSVLSHILAILVEQRAHSSVRNLSTSDKVADAIIFMSEHLHEPVKVSALARLANLSPTYFTGLFKEQAGCAPRDYLHLLRIHRACQLLTGTSLSVKQIAADVGYQDPFHFSRQFKAFHGVSPTEFRGARAST